MAFTTVADLVEYTNEVYSFEEQARYGALIPHAERRLRFAAGGAFFVASDRTADASQDWILATVLIVHTWLGWMTEDQWEAARSPLISETWEDYRYELRATDLSSFPDVGNDPRVASIIAQYNPAGGPGTLQQGSITYRVLSAGEWT